MTKTCGPDREDCRAVSRMADDENQKRSSARMSFRSIGR